MKRIKAKIGLFVVRCGLRLYELGPKDWWTEDDKYDYEKLMNYERKFKKALEAA